MDVLAWAEVAHGGFEAFVAHPCLDGSDVEACSEHFGGVGAAEFAEVESFGVLA